MVEPLLAPKRGGNVAIVATDMGYGHLRAADALARALGVWTLLAEEPPLADPTDQKLWRRARTLYEFISRASQARLVGRPLRAVLDTLTAIPHLYPVRDQSAPTVPVRSLDRRIREGFGRTLTEQLRAWDAGLLTTFFAPALAADHHGLGRIVCVVTDSDLNRVWVPLDPVHSRIHYCVGSDRALRRLRAYGVPSERIHMTGFPLPLELLGGEDLDGVRAALRGRLVRLDPRGAFRTTHREELRQVLGGLEEASGPPLLTFAVGGAGAQLELVRAFLPSLQRPLRQGRLRLAMVAGTRPRVAARLAEDLAESDLSDVVEVLFETSTQAYFTRFNQLLRRTDVLWTKPSELTFFAAAGVPLVMSSPVGVHERYNRRWALQRGAGVKQQNPRHAWSWLEEWLDEGVLAAAAWSGFRRLPAHGTWRILEVVDRVWAG